MLALAVGFAQAHSPGLARVLEFADAVAVFVADSIGGAIHAFGLPEAGVVRGRARPCTLLDLEGLLTEGLGTVPRRLTCHDLAVHPLAHGVFAALLVALIARYVAAANFPQVILKDRLFALDVVRQALSMNNGKGKPMTMLAFAATISRNSIDGARERRLPSAAKDFFAKIEAADAILVSLAKHNGFVTAAWKNVFDWISRIAMKLWQGRPADGHPAFRRRPARQPRYGTSNRSTPAAGCATVMVTHSREAPRSRAEPELPGVEFILNDPSDPRRAARKIS